MGGVLLVCFFFIIITVATNLAILDENPIYAVLYLIGAFIFTSSLLIFLSADYIAVLIILLYGGAISILIMFVVMMLDLQKIEMEKTVKIDYVKVMNFLFLALGAVFLITVSENYVLYDFLRYTNWFETINYKTNIEVIGIVLYNYYFFQFILLGFLLFLSMIVVITIVLRKRYNSKFQNVSDQVSNRNGWKKLFWDWSTLKENI